MNTTSKASNAFEAFFGIHELPPPPSPPTSPLSLSPLPPQPTLLPPLPLLLLLMPPLPPLLPLPPPPPWVLSTTLKARKLHWHNSMANIGIDIIKIRISQQRHGERNTDRAHEDKPATSTNQFSLLSS